MIIKQKKIAVKNNEIEIEYNKKIDRLGSVGCPILLENNNKLIAVQGKVNKNGKFKGIILNFIVNEYSNKNKNIIKNTGKKNNYYQEDKITNKKMNKIENDDQKYNRE